MSSPHTFASCQLVLEQGPVDSPSIRQVSPHDQRNFLLIELFDCDLQRICLTLEIDQYRRIHAEDCYQPDILKVLASRTLSATLLSPTP
jgi:hypothetical protein